MDGNSRLHGCALRVCGASICEGIGSCAPGWEGIV